MMVGIHSLRYYFLLFLLQGCTYSQNIDSIPSLFRGLWNSQYTSEILLEIESSSIKIIYTESVTACRAEKLATIKKSVFLSNLELVVICDKRSTDGDQKSDRELGTVAPPDYRKTIYITYPNETGIIEVRETKWMSKGWEGSEGVYEWQVDIFTKSDMVSD